jgi:hypothetical protein
MTNAADPTDFIQRATIKFNGLYTYHPETYKGINHPMRITCPTHGDIMQSPWSHMRSKEGCAKCGKEKRQIGHTAEKRQKAKDDFITKASERFNNKYDYSKVNYMGDGVSVIIVCPMHGDFSQTPNKHTHSSVGCGECVKLLLKRVNSKKKPKIKKLIDEREKKFIKKPKTKKSTGEREKKFIKKATEKYTGKFDYSLVIYNTKNIRVVIICPIHGVFTQTPEQHLKTICGCIKCGKAHAGLSRMDDNET